MIIKSKSLGHKKWIKLNLVNVDAFYRNNFVVVYFYLIEAKLLKELYNVVVHIDQYSGTATRKTTTKGKQQLANQFHSKSYVI